MAVIAHFIGFGAERPAPLLATLSARLGTALRRTASGRYAEQRERIARTGLAGVV